MYREDEAKAKREADAYYERMYYQRQRDREVMDRTRSWLGDYSTRDIRDKTENWLFS